MTIPASSKGIEHAFQEGQKLHKDAIAAYAAAVRAKGKEYLAAHHFKGRSCKATRLMLDNGVTLCAGHHAFNYQFSAHRTPEAFTTWFKKAYPNRYRNVIEKAQSMMTEGQAVYKFVLASFDAAFASEVEGVHREAQQ